MELRTDEERNIAYIKIAGSLNREIILEAFDAVVSDSRYKKGMSRLWDFRDADLSSLDSSTIAAMAQYPMKFPPGISNVKVAFVASRGLEFGLSRMFQALSGDRSSAISVFYTMEDAETWLSE